MTDTKAPSPLLDEVTTCSTCDQPAKRIVGSFCRCPAKQEKKDGN